RRGAGRREPPPAAPPLRLDPRPGAALGRGSVPLAFLYRARRPPAQAVGSIVGRAGSRLWAIGPMADLTQSGITTTPRGSQRRDHRGQIAVAGESQLGEVANRVAHTQWRTGLARTLHPGEL